MKPNTDNVVKVLLLAMVAIGLFFIYNNLQNQVNQSNFDKLLQKQDSMILKYQKEIKIEKTNQELLRKQLSKVEKKDYKISKHKILIRYEKIFKLADSNNAMELDWFFSRVFSKMDSI